MPREGADHRPDRLDPVGRHRQPAGQHRPGLGQAVQHHAALRDRALAAAHPGHLRRRRRARLRPPVPGAAVPAVDRHGRHLGPGRRPGRRPGHRERAARPPAGTGTSPRSRTWRGTTGGAATTRPGPRSPRSPRRMGAANVQRHAERPRRRACRSPPRSSTSPATPSRSTATTGCRRAADPLPAGHVPAVVRGRASTRARTRSWSTPARSTAIPATASHFLLTTELRDRLGFKGVVISDYGDVPALADHLPHRPRPGRRGRPGDQRRRRHGHAAVQRRPAGRPAVQQDVADGSISDGADQPGGRADPHAEVPARAVRPPVRRRQRGRRRRRRPARDLARCRPPTSRSRCCATRTTRCRFADQQGRRDRAERGLDDEPARRLERQLAGRVRRRPRVLRGTGRPDPARHHGAQGPAGRGPQRDVTRRTRPTAVADAGVGGRRGRRGRREGRTPRASATTPRPQLHARPAGADQRPGGDRQAGDRRGRRGPAARPRPGGEGQRDPDGLPGQHRGGHGGRRRAVRQGQPERQAAGDLAVRRAPRPAVGLQHRRHRHRSATSRRSSTSCRAPNSGQGRGYNPLYPFGFGLSYTTFSTSGLCASAVPTAPAT